MRFLVNLFLIKHQVTAWRARQGAGDLSSRELSQQWKALKELLKNSLSIRNRALRDIRASWAKPGTKDAWLATRLFDITSDNAMVSVVDEKTWTDLELKAFYSELDTTVTPVGSQYLYRTMRTYVQEEEQIKKNWGTYRVLRDRASLREEIQINLRMLRNDSNALICESLFGPSPGKPRLAWLIFLFSGISVVTCIATLLNHSLLWIYLLVIACNVAILYWVEKSFHETYSTATRVGTMIGLASRLGRIVTSSEIPQIQGLQKILRETEQLQKAFRWFLNKRDDSLIGSLFFYLQVLFLVDLVIGIRSLKKLCEFREPLKQIFELIGSLDASIAVASMITRIPRHCVPVIVNDRHVRFKAAYHPILSEPVPNSITLEGCSALIVGTNMAGKTTFIKMIGANIITGRTLGVCFADAAVIPKSPVMASIRAEHSIESGKSHFFSELERIRLFVEKAESRECGMFLIDELFRGTNTPERIAAGKAVLEAIAEHTQVLVTTHDIELQCLLSNFQVFHFTEDPELPQIFDYRLRTGVSTSRNAIALLERVGFSEVITLEARRMLDALGPRAAMSDQPCLTHKKAYQLKSLSFP